MLNFEHYIFDLDGTLVETKPVHRAAFSAALENMGLPLIREEDIELFEAMPSSNKINLYKEIYKVDVDMETFLDRKQNITLSMMGAQDFSDDELKASFRRIAFRNGRISICSNCTLSTIRKVLDNADLLKYVDFIAHNKSAAPKPNPDLYQLCIKESNIDPQKTVIFEDNEKGLAAAFAASKEVSVIRVLNPTQLKRFL